MTESRATPKVRRRQNTTLLMLVLIGTINYIDRSTLSIGNTLIRQDLGLSLTQMGWLLSAFLWAYAISQLPCGLLVDRFGARRVLGIGLFIWSLAQALCGMVFNFFQFIIARVCLGMGESPMFVSNARAVRDWFPLSQRGKPTGIYNCVSTLGPTVAPPLLTALMLNFGWRWMFIIMGIVGIVVSIIWFIIYRYPHHTDLIEEERNYLVAGEENEPESTTDFAEWIGLFRFRVTWGLMLGYFGTIYLMWLFMTWLPSYLEMERGMSLQKTGWVAAIPYAFGIIGSIGTGYIVDWASSKGITPVEARRYIVSFSLVIMSVFTFLCALTASNVLAVIFICIVMFGVGSATAMAWAMVSVLAARSVTGSLGGIMSAFGYVGGALAPTVTGYIAQFTGSFIPALLVGSCIGILSAMIYLFFLPKTALTEEDIGRKH